MTGQVFLDDQGRRVRVITSEGLWAGCIEKDPGEWTIHPMLKWEPNLVSAICALKLLAMVMDWDEDSSKET